MSSVKIGLWQSYSTYWNTWEFTCTLCICGPIWVKSCVGYVHILPLCSCEFHEKLLWISWNSVQWKAYFTWWHKWNIVLVLYIICYIWITFVIGDVHKNLLSDYVFCKNQCSESRVYLGMQMNYFHVYYVIWGKFGIRDLIQNVVKHCWV